MHKLRVLCLHGYHGSADTLRSQMTSLVTGLASLAELVCVDAPTLSRGDFGWWHAVQNEEAAERGDPGVASRRKHYKGWSKTRDWIVSLFQQQRFDGVFGFSQGAALAGLLVGLRAPDGKPTGDKPLSFDFAMMVGGFRSNDPLHASLYASRESYSLPSVHIIGRSDFIVPPGDSHGLASAFLNPLILEHDGGHVVASTPDVRTQVKRFLEERRKAHAGQQTQLGAQGVPGAT